MMKNTLGCLIALLLSMGIGGVINAQEHGFFSSPNAHGDVLVFSSEGDLWRGAITGGTATRITTHPQVENNPAISPDGKSLAFNAQYDGPQEVYVMPLSGGRPVQLTFEGGGVQVLGWSPDNKVLFSSSNEPGTRPRVLRTVDPSTSKVTTIPLLDATTGTFESADQLYFTRFGLTLSNDNARLYRGGRMAQLWRYAEASGQEAVRLAADFGAPIRHPMWWDGRVYFISDKSGSDNIWSVDPDGSDVRQVTSFEGWQLRAPSLAEGNIYYQRGADLFVFDIAQGTDRQLNIQLDSDRDFTRTRWLEAPLRYLDQAHIGPKGKSVTVTARANVALAFPGSQRRIELSIPEEARARDAQLGAEEEWIYTIIDQGLAGEIWRFPADGRGEGEQLTQSSDAHIWSIYPSPDGKRLVYDDKLGRLWSLDITTRRKTLLETSDSGSDVPFTDFNWSRHGRYLAYTAPNQRGLNQVILRDMQTGERKPISGDKYVSFSPAFSPAGDWLYFVSHRNFQASPSAPWGDRNTGPGFDRRGKIYGLQLVIGAKFPFKPDDELSADGNGKASDKKEDDSKTDPAIAFDDLENRLWEVPVEADNRSNLQVNKGFLFYLSRNDNKTALKAVKIDPVKSKVSNLVDNVRGFELSADGKTIFYMTGGNEAPSLLLIPAKEKKPADLSSHRVRVGDWRLRINPRAEWRQQFLDAWRLHRDFAYDPNLRGVDWDGVRDKYLPFVDRIGHRFELADLLSQMATELGILHSQIGGGDQPRDGESGAIASLGARFEASDSGLEVVQIYQGERELLEQLGPLLKPGIDVRVGDTLVGVDGRLVRSEGDLSRALLHKADQEVRLDLVRGRSPFSVIVKPVGGGADGLLKYRHWVETNRRSVQGESNGEIGYLHLRAMGGGDIASFVRDFYQHYDKDGLIIDVRGNRGGNIDSYVLSILLRQVWAFWESPLGGQPTTNMQQTFRGHLAVIVNEGTYSDGETFAAGIKALDLGPLIGTRTAGAGIWLSDRNRLSDNGIARIAESAQSGLDGRWLIEGRGISPDIEVVNPPHASFQGQDAQLTAAIQYLQNKISNEPIPALKAEPLPPLGRNGRDVQN